jgi:hypothetical protein
VAEVTKAYDLLASLVPRLQAVRLANGYASESGQSVLLGPIPRQHDERLPYIRLHETDAAAEDAMRNRPQAKVRTSFMAEAYAEQPQASQIMATGHELVGDLKKAMFGDTARDLDGRVMDAQFEGYRIVPPDDGSTVIVAQVRGSFVFVDHFNAP